MRLPFSIFAFVVAKQWESNEITIDEVQRRPLSAAFEINLDKVDVWIEGLISEELKKTYKIIFRLCERATTTIEFGKEGKKISQKIGHFSRLPGQCA